MRDSVAVPSCDFLPPYVFFPFVFQPFSQISTKNLVNTLWSPFLPWYPSLTRPRNTKLKRFTSIVSDVPTEKAFKSHVERQFRSQLTSHSSQEFFTYLSWHERRKKYSPFDCICVTVENQCLQPRQCRRRRLVRLTGDVQ